MKFLILFFVLNTLQLDCEVFKNILKNEKITNYLHTKLPGRETLFMVKNQYCELNGNAGDLVVMTVDEEIAIKKKNYLKLISVKTDNGCKTLMLEYPIEGAVFMVRLDGNDRILNVDVLEK
jgi:hypothetical protein